VKKEEKEIQKKIKRREMVNRKNKRKRRRRDRQRWVPIQGLLEI
jgi:ATP-dependent RNA helicase DDX46/PRP5